MNDELRELYEIKKKADADYEEIEGGLWNDDEMSNLLLDIQLEIEGIVSIESEEKISNKCLRINNIKLEIMNKFYLPLMEVLNGQIKKLDS